MNLKKITSLVMLLAMIVMTYTGVILFLSPQGRIANWANWELLGLTKIEYTAVHSTFMVIFIIAGLLHIYYNFRPIVSYLSNQAKELVIFTKEMIVAIVVTVVFVTGTLYEMAPFNTFLSFGETAKDYWIDIYGEPPYGHAELSSLKVFIKKIKLDEKEAITNLQQAGIIFDSLDEKLIDIAKKNNKSPNDIYEIMDAESKI
ncbi:MAG: DUF4405 domain-containing protein [Arcobacteraceae bacterium]|nr:DUF4405 domain-containing protein [Arcobacteraceae bacterium]